MRSAQMGTLSNLIAWPNTTRPSRSVAANASSEVARAPPSGPPWLEPPGSAYLSGSAKTMSSATIVAPISLRRAMISPMRSRRQGHCPIVDRLRSSTSTMTTRPLGSPRVSGSNQDVVGGVVQSSEQRGWKHREHAGDDHGTDAAQKHETPPRRPGLQGSRQSCGTTSRRCRRADCGAPAFHRAS